jgi:ribonucleoside-diphosphate reductase alpha chain
MSNNIEQKAFEWLNQNQLSYDIWDKKYRVNDESFDEWLDRVSGKDEEIRRLIKEKKFLFGGRTLANRGTNKGSFSNCYSHGYIEDSLDGIMDAAKNIAMTFKAQGGQGLSLSKIRPKGAMIGGKFKSDGIVPFMEIFNTVTESVSQGGSRKGALLMSLDINHPEAETFMTIKSDLKKINKANLSMEIDNGFMWDVTSGGEEAKRKFDLLCEQACKYAEPGVIYTHMFRNYNLMEKVDEYQIETCNPCGEQPLPKHGACNLASINLSAYVLNPYTQDVTFDYDALTHDMYNIVRAMDDVLEENLPNHALPEQRKMAEKYRNVGIGVMGIHDVFIKFGFKYGGRQSVVLLEDIMGIIFRSAVYASVDLASQRGNCLGYDSKI